MVVFEGIEQIIARLEKLEDTEKMSGAIKKSCALVERDAKKKAPKGVTGDLKKTIKSKVEVVGTDVIGTVFSPEEYSPYVEYGTGLFAEKGGRTDVPWCYKDERTDEFIWTYGQHPQPFMRPALEENKEKIKKLISKEGLSSD